MPITVPTSPAAMRDTLSRLCRSYRATPPTDTELDDINSIISAFRATYPQFDSRLNLKRDSVRKLDMIARLTDDAYWPMVTSSAYMTALNTYFGKVSLDRYEGSGSAYGGGIPDIWYWNGEDTTLEQILSSQWGIDIGSATVASGAISNGTVGSLAGVYDGIYPGVTVTNMYALQIPVVASPLLYITVPNTVTLSAGSECAIVALSGVEQTSVYPELVGTTMRAGVNERVYSFDRSTLVGFYMNIKVTRFDATTPFYVRFWNSNPV